MCRSTENITSRQWFILIRNFDVIAIFTCKLSGTNQNDGNLKKNKRLTFKDSYKVMVLPNASSCVSNERTNDRTCKQTKK